MPEGEQLEQRTEDVVRLGEQTKALRRELSETEQAFGRFSSGVASKLSTAIVQGKSLRDVFRSLALDLSRTLLASASKSLTSSIGGLFQSAGQSLVAPIAAAAPAAIPFAKGGVIDGPGLFPLGSGLGLAGEAGPEAILPLARGSDGRLGIRSGQASQPTSVTVNIATQDASSFQRSEAQVSRMLARAVARGQRKL